jgi:hypothetical protein
MNNKKNHLAIYEINFKTFQKFIYLFLSQVHPNDLSNYIVLLVDDSVIAILHYWIDIAEKLLLIHLYLKFYLILSDANIMKSILIIEFQILH